MNLTWYLTLRIVVLAFLCLLLASGYVLWRAEREQQRHMLATVESITEQVHVRVTTPMGFRPTALDRDGRFLFWRPNIDSEAVTGICFRYVDESEQVRATTCQRWGQQHLHNRWNENVPAWFSAFYSVVFNPGEEKVYPLSWNDRNYGSVIATPDPENKIAEAWHEISALMGLTTGTVLVLCILVYFVIGRALRPTREILQGLERLELGELSTRLPKLELRELQKMSEVFNRLASTLEQSIAERTELTRKLVNVQEEERRYLARELHDEFGQCLAAIKAVATGVIQTAERERSSLVIEGEKLSQIANHMMLALRGMLKRLRPPGIDELGLVESLEGLVAQCNSRSTRIEFEACGNFDALPEAVAVGVFRIVQECLTNVSKHANATSVKVKVERNASEHREGGIEVTVEDDGQLDRIALARTPGMGLLGMRERITALGGQLMLRPRPANGLVVHARIPIASIA